MGGRLRKPTRCRCAHHHQVEDAIAPNAGPICCRDSCCWRSPASEATHRRPGCRPGSRAPPRCCRGTCSQGAARVAHHFCDRLADAHHGQCNHCCHQMLSRHYSRLSSASSCAGVAVQLVHKRRRPAAAHTGRLDTHHSSRSVAAATMVRRAACSIGEKSAGQGKLLGVQGGKRANGV